MHGTVHHSSFLFQPTNAQIYITTVSLYIMHTPTCFDIGVSSSVSFTSVPRYVSSILKTEAVNMLK